MSDPRLDEDVGADHRLHPARALSSTGAVPLGVALTNADYVVLVADEGMRYLTASDAACSLLGYSRDELLALTVPDLVVESNASELFEHFLRDEAQRGTITLRRKDGRLVVATYDARTTVVDGVSYYISVLSPLPVDNDEPGSSPGGSSSMEGKRDATEPERRLRGAALGGSSNQIGAGSRNRTAPGRRLAPADPAAELEQLVQRIAASPCASMPAPPGTARPSSRTC
jgi:PAS domain S-box-containing protein